MGQQASSAGSVGAKKQTRSVIDFSRYQAFSDWQLVTAGRYLELIKEAEEQQLGLNYADVDQHGCIMDIDEHEKDLILNNDEQLMKDDDEIREENMNINDDGDDDQKTKLGELIMKQLPDEIIEQILLFLSVKNVIVMERVSKGFSTLIRLDGFWGEKLKQIANETRMYFKPISYKSDTSPKSKRDFVVLHERFMWEIGKLQMRSEKHIDYLHNVIFSGPTKSGKSEYLRRMASSSEFNSNYQATIGVEFFVKYYTDTQVVMKFLIWDTSGNPQFSYVTSSYYRGSEIVVFAFDLGDSTSFENMKKQIIEMDKQFYIFREMKEFDKNPKLFMILGMKRDLERQVSQQEVSKYLDELSPTNCSVSFSHVKLVYFEISAKEDSIQTLQFPLQYAYAFRMSHNCDR